MSCSHRGDLRGEAATSCASYQIVQSLTYWAERMPLAFSLFVITEIYFISLLLYVVCIHRIGNVMYFTYVKKLFSLADLTLIHSEKAHRGGKPNLNEGGVREPGKWTSNARAKRFASNDRTEDNFSS